jgi:hypothetical protein
MWQFECSEETTASPTEVWALWSRPARWPEYDEGIVRARLDGPFVAGAKVRLKPKGGPTSWLEIVTAEPERGFSTLAKLPLAQLRFSHEVTDAGDGKHLLTSRIRVTGALSRVVARLFRLAGNEVAMLRNLARLAEQQEPRAGSS